MPGAEINSSVIARPAAVLAEASTNNGPRHRRDTAAAAAAKCRLNRYPAGPVGVCGRTQRPMISRRALRGLPFVCRGHSSCDGPTQVLSSDSGSLLATRPVRSRQFLCRASSLATSAARLTSSAVLASSSSRWAACSFTMAACRAGLLVGPSVAGASRLRSAANASALAGRLLLLLERQRRSRRSSAERTDHLRRSALSW